MTSRMEIRVCRPRNSNYTPADLIIAWAKENRRPYSHTRDSRLFVSIGGLPFVYDHWAITPIDETTDQIDITLTQISAWELT